MPRRETWNADVLAGLTGANALTLHPYIQVQDATVTPQSLLSLPYARVQSLAATEFPQLASYGLDAWVTAFNMVDKTPALTFAGTWTHGLFVAAYALLLAQNPTVTLVDLHNAVGDAVAGVLFDSIDGFRAATPVTELLGRSAMGATYAALLQATKSTSTAQPLTFPAGPVLEGGAPGIVGMDFSGGGQQRMKIAVLVKEVPDTWGDRSIDPVTKRVVRGKDLVIDEINEKAVEAALLVKEANSGATLTVVTMGPKSALDALPSSPSVATKSMKDSST